jgi:hypothetical protein
MKPVVLRHVPIFCIYYESFRKEVYKFLFECHIK